MTSKYKMTNNFSENYRSRMNMVFLRRAWCNLSNCITLISWKRVRWKRRWTMHLGSLVPESPRRVDQWETRYWASAGENFNYHWISPLTSTAYIIESLVPWNSCFPQQLSGKKVTLTRSPSLPFSYKKFPLLHVSGFWLFNFPITHHTSLIPIDFLYHPSFANSTDLSYHIISTSFCHLNLLPPHLKNGLYWFGLRACFAFQNQREATSTDVVVNFNDLLHVSFCRH